MQAADDRRLLSGASSALLCLTAAFAVGACIVALRDQMTVLFADDWRMLDRYQSRPLLRFLFGSENGHRLPATLALFAIDYEWLGGRMRTLVLASIACTALTAGLFGRIFRSQGGLDRALTRSVLGFACFALVWAVSCNDLLRGIYHMSLQTVALLALGLAALGEVDPRRIPASRPRLVLAALAAFLASWSHGVGAACWAALVAVAVVRRFPWRVVAGLGAAGAATTALYVATLPPDPKNSFEASLAMVAHDPGALAGMALAFIGSGPARVAAGLGIGEPYPRDLQIDRWAAHTRDLHRLAVVFGAAGLLHFAIAAAARWRRPRHGPALDTLIVGLMAFATAAALLVSFVRCPTEGPTGVLHARFLVWSTLFWIGSACALVPRSPATAGGPLAPLAVLALAILSAAMLPALRDARDYHAATRSHASKLSLALLLGLRHDELARGVSIEDAETVYRVASRLEAERRWPFDGARQGLRGSALAERFAPAPPCAGGIERRRALGDFGAVAGWLVPPPERERPAFVVLVDRGGAIRGLADFESVPPQQRAGARPDALAWTGFVADFDPAEPYAAYAVLGDERRACPLRTR
jgi:hypothetical protein